MVQYYEQAHNAWLLAHAGTVEIAKETTEHTSTEPVDAEDAAAPFRAEEK